MSRVGNALNMLRLLSTGRKYSIKELSTILEVSPRMIRQYKNDLEQAGIYIDTVMGKNGGYVYDGRESFNQRLSLEDLRFAENIRYMLHKSKNVPEKIKTDMDALIDKIRFLTIIKEDKKNNKEMDKSMIKVLIDAIKDRKVLQIEIVDSLRKRSQFTPCFYNVYNDCYYFTGILKQNNEMRTFSQYEIKVI